MKMAVDTLPSSTVIISQLKYSQTNYVRGQIEFPSISNLHARNILRLRKKFTREFESLNCFKDYVISTVNDYCVENNAAHLINEVKSIVEMIFATPSEYHAIQPY